MLIKNATLPEGRVEHACTLCSPELTKTFKASSSYKVRRKYVFSSLSFIYFCDMSKTAEKKGFKDWNYQFIMRTERENSTCNKDLKIKLEKKNKYC